MKRHKRSYFSTTLLTVGLCFGVIGVMELSTKLMDSRLTSESSSVSQSQSQSQSQPDQVAVPASTVRLTAVGDNLIHDNIYRQAAARAGDSGYDFAPVYQRVLPLFQGADIQFVNQETPLAQSKFPLSGYPRFNSPDAVGDALIKMGFNVINHANNHMFDMNEEGLISTMDFWKDKADILSMGTWRNESDMSKPILMSRNDITIGFVPITEHTNGLKLPAETSIRFIRSDEYELMEQQIELAKANSDFVVVSIHWGTESSTKTNPNQKELAQFFADQGVNLVIGHHSHTLQPIEWVEGKDGNRMLIAYSLGNFVSSMLEPQHMLGAVLDVEITKDYPSNTVSITKAEIKPFVTQYDGAGRKDVRLYPIEEYTNELANAHGVKIEYSYFGLDYFKGIIEENIPAEFRPNLKFAA